jgi:predicted phosphoribosyltransferase
MSDEKEQLTLLIQESFKNLYQYLNLKFKEVDANFEAVNSRLEKLEANSSEDVIALLKQIQKNTKGLSTD